MNLQGYMSSAIRRIMEKAYLNVLSNPREAKTVYRLQKTFLQSEKRRLAVAQESGVDVPPFLICSISTECNLSCKGCYARANGIADNPGKSTRPTLTPEPGTEHLAFGDEDLELISFPGDEKHMGGCLAAGRGFFHIGPDGNAEPCPFSPYSDSNVLTLGVKGALQSPLFKKLRAVHLVGGEHSGGCALWEHREEVEQMLNSK